LQKAKANANIFQSYQPILSKQKASAHNPDTDVEAHMTNAAPGGSKNTGVSIGEVDAESHYKIIKDLIK